MNRTEESAELEDEFSSVVGSLMQYHQYNRNELHDLLEQAIEDYQP